MALAKQTIALPFRGGIDTKTDPKQVGPVKLLALENAVFTSPGRIQKRNGFDGLPRAVSTNAASITQIATGNALATYKDELLAFDERNIFSWNDASQQWVWKGVLPSCQVQREAVSNTSESLFAQDGVTHSSGLQAYAWETLNGVFYSVVDSLTGQRVVASAQLGTSATAAKPRVVTVNNVFVFVYYDTTTTQLHLGVLPIGAPTSTISFTAITSNLNDEDSIDTTTPVFDVCAFTTASLGPQIYVAFNNRAAAGGTTLRRFAGSNPTTVASQVEWEDVSNVIDIFPDPFYSAPVVVHYDGTTETVRFREYAAALVDGSGSPVLLGFSAVEQIANVGSLTGAGTSSTALSLRIFYTIKAASLAAAAQDYVRFVAYDAASYDELTAAGAGTGTYLSEATPTTPPADFLRSVSIAAKAFVYDEEAHVPLVHTSGLQSTLFFADEDRNVVAKALYGIAGNRANAASKAMGAVSNPRVTAIDPTKYRLGVLEQVELTNLAGLTSTINDTGVVSITLDFFDGETNYLRSEIADVLHVNGGFLWMYDGISPVEHNFHLYPENVIVTTGAGSTYNYQYVAVYKWTDNQGLTHRSAPSPIYSYSSTNPIGPNPDEATVRVPTLRLTAKQSQNAVVDRSPVVIEIYRTENNLNVFRKVGEEDNTVTADYVDFTDEVTDADLADEILLYTTGGVVENIAAPPTSVLAVHRNRLCVLDATDPLNVWFSKQATAGAPVEFSDVFTFRVDPRGGDVTALANLDDKLLIFKRTHVFAVTGQGPDATGANYDFSDAILVTTDAGCVNPRSIVTVPDGLVFQSEKGIYFIGRDLAVSYIGAEVEAYNDQTITSGQLIADKNQVRLTLGNRTALVFDYFVRQWSVFTNLAAVDSTLWRGDFVWLRSDGTAMVENTGFTDNGSFIRMRATTAWLQFAGLQGFQRIYKVLVLGEYETPHKLLVKIAYDFDPNPTQSTTVEPSNPGTYGSATPYGSGVYGGGTFPLYQWRIFTARQKCQAIQLTLEDAPEAGETPGQSMSLSALTLEVGVMGGANRLPAAKSFG